MSICDQKISQPYFRVNRYLSSTEKISYIFVGKKNKNLKTVMEKIENGTKLTKTDISKLEKSGIPYQLNADNQKFIYDTIELDDSIVDVRNKLFRHLNTSHDPVLPEYVTLFTKKNNLILSYIGGKGKKEDKKKVIYPVNPFDDIKKDVVDIESTWDMLNKNKYPSSVASANLDIVELINMNLIDIDDTLSKNPELNMVCAFDLIKEFKVSKKNYELFREGFLRKYFRTSKMSLLDQHDSYSNLIKQAVKLSQNDNMKQQKAIISKQSDLTNWVNETEQSEFLNFSNCSILEIVINVNYNEAEEDYIELSKIFDIYKLSLDVPFVKYKGDKLKDPKSKVYDDAIKNKVIDKTMLYEWQSNVVSVNDETEQMSLSKIGGKGLSFKKFLYKGKYSTINFYKDGKYEIKLFWEESKNAQLSELEKALKDISLMVKDINKIRYQSPGFSGKKIMALPDFKNINKPGSNTTISFINTSMKFSLPELGNLSFGSLNKFAEHFWPYSSVVQRNVVQEVDNDGNIIDHITEPTMLQLRYKKISNYQNQKVIHRFLDEILTKAINIDNQRAYEILSERFGKTLSDSKLIFDTYKKNFRKKDMARSSLEYVLGHSIKKQPGIDVKILLGKGGYKIFTIGVTNMYYLTRIHNFAKSMMSRYIETLIDEKLHKNFLEASKFDGETVIHENDDEIDMDIINEEDGQENYDDLFGDIDDLEDDDDKYDFDLDDEEDEFAEGDYDLDEPTEEVDKKQKINEALKAQSKLVSDDVYTGERLFKRLKKISPELFGSNYGTKCQSERQPIAISPNLVKELNKNVVTEIEEVKADNSISKKEKTNRLNFLDNVKKINAGGLTYEGNHYLCPTTWCFKCKSYVPYYKIITKSKDGKKMSCPNCGANIFIRKHFNTSDGSLSGERFYAGFVSTGAPCCFSNPKQKWDEFLSQKKVEVNRSTTYIYMSDKSYIPESRYGFLPEKLNNLFNGTDTSCDINPPTIKQPGLNCYLRNGVEPGHRSFLSAVAQLRKRKKNTAESVINDIVNKLTAKQFKTFKNGSLRMIFGGESDEESLNNFKKYIQETKHTLNENLLWDLVSNSNLVHTTTFNLLIINIITNGDKISNIVLSCPIGYDHKRMFDKKRKTLILLKRNDSYEVLTHIDSGSIRRLFDSDELNISKMIDIVKSTCAPIVNTESYNNLVKYIEDDSKELVKSVEPFSAGEIIDELWKLTNNFPEYKKFAVKGQIIDAYNRIEYIVCENNLLIPVDLYSAPFEKMKEFDYDKIKPLSYKDTIINLLILNKLTPIPVRPVKNVLNEKSEVVGIMVESISIIRCQPILLKDIEKEINVTIELGKGSGLHKISWIANKTQVITKKYFNEDIDKNLSSTKNEDDFRSTYVNMINFEHESYHRLRYELSRFITMDGMEHYQDSIRNIIDSDDELEDKRRLVYNIFMDIIKTNKLVKLVSSDEIDASKYVFTNVRYACFEKEENDVQDMHCSWDKKTNSGKLIITKTNLVTGNKNNYERYVSLISEEIVRNPHKSFEIMNDQVSNYINEDLLTKREGETIFTDTGDAKSVKMAIDDLYRKEVSINQANEKLFDVKNSENVKSNLDNFCTVSTRKLTDRKVTELLGFDFKILRNRMDTCIFYNISDMLGIKGKKIVNSIADYVEELSDVGIRSGWEQLIRYYKASHFNSSLYKNIETLEELQDFMRSDNHSPIDIDISIFSRLYNIKPIIINSSGLKCLKTTQTLEDKCIILYHEENDYMLVSDEDDKCVFSISELPVKLVDEWKKCDDDHKKLVDKDIKLISTVKKILKKPDKKEAIVVKYGAQKKKSEVKLKPKVSVKEGDIYDTEKNVVPKKKILKRPSSATSKPKKKIIKKSGVVLPSKLQ